MSHYRMPILDETGYVVLDSYGGVMDPAEWMDLEYVDWKSSGDTRFAPIASAQGQIECNGFWHSDPPKADKDGVWIPSQVAKAPTLAARAQAPGANVGRSRVIELQPNTYADCLYNSHLDDNNRLNPEGEGWVPNITQKSLKDWSEKDIAWFLKTGELPTGDTAGGSMARVIRNTSQLSDEDRAAMAAYLKSLPAVDGPPRLKVADGRHQDHKH